MPRATSPKRPCGLQSLDWRTSWPAKQPPQLRLNIALRELAENAGKIGTPTSPPTGPRRWPRQWWPGTGNRHYSQPRCLGHAQTRPPLNESKLEYAIVVKSKTRYELLERSTRPGRLSSTSSARLERRRQRTPNLRNIAQEHARIGGGGRGDVAARADHAVKAVVERAFLPSSCLPITSW
jgi:hypothetical protein